MEEKKTFANILATHLQGKLSAETIENLIEKPKYETQGDLAFPCFTLAKTFKKAPQQIAMELADGIEDTLFDKVVADGPYVNCFINKEIMSEKVLSTILKEGEHYGSNAIGGEENIVIDFSSPNIAKPFSMGHLRSTVIGNSLAHIVHKRGYNPVRINHLGDWGTQFGKLIVAYKQWGTEDLVRANPIKELLDLYVKFHTEAEIEHSLENEARAWFKALEEGNDEAESLWKWFRDESLNEFSKIYDLLGVRFDAFQGEAFYNDKLESTMTLLHESGLLEKSDGAEVIRLDDQDLPPCLIKKSDGATLYATRDITAALYRQKEYQFTKALYVVGHEQSVHFNQIILVLKKLGMEWADSMQHVPFGFILKDGKKMSTRKGKVVLLEEVIKETITLAKQNIHEKNPGLVTKDEVAKAVGVGAIIFHDLKNGRLHNVEFRLEDMLHFEGATGPYVQYTHARACSILKKSEYTPHIEDIQGSQDTQNWHVVKALQQFPEVIDNAFSDMEPSHIAKYVLHLSKTFNKYYAHVRILHDDAERDSRLALVMATTIVLKEGLRLLGMDAPEEM